jgi:transposase-like protein
MLWKATRPMDQKLLFVRACQRGQMNMAETCEAFGISRKTGYKWLARYESHGALGLEERSRAPSKNRLAQQRAFDAFRQDYNEVRPHEALGQVPPSAIYKPSDRSFERVLRDPHYTEDVEPVRVRTDGTLKWQGHHCLLTDFLAGELVGCMRLETGGWALSYGPLELGLLDSDGRFRQKNPDGVTDVPGLKRYRCARPYRVPARVRRNLNRADNWGG